MRMITTNDLEALAEQINTAFARKDKEIANLQKEIKVLKEFVNAQAKPDPKKKVAKKT
jgi:hypothetical protein